MSVGLMDDLHTLSMKSRYYAVFHVVATFEHIVAIAILMGREFDKRAKRTQNRAFQGVTRRAI
jgi:hypothetical protein